MDEELVKQLREPCQYENCILCQQAADAIEELSAAEKKYLANISALETENQHLKRERYWIPVTEEPPLKVGDDGYSGYLVYANGYYEVSDYKGYFHVDGKEHDDYNKPKDCPLVPVPPHGRCIDADALKASLAFAEKTAEWAVPALRAVLMIIDEMPTIIPAESVENK